MKRPRVVVTLCERPVLQGKPDEKIRALVICTLDGRVIEPLLVGYEKTELVSLPVRELGDPVMTALVSMISGPARPLNHPRITDADRDLVLRTVIEHVRRIQGLPDDPIAVEPAPASSPVPTWISPHVEAVGGVQFLIRPPTDDRVALVFCNLDGALLAPVLVRRGSDGCMEVTTVDTYVDEQGNVVDARAKFGGISFDDPVVTPVAVDRVVAAALGYVQANGLR